MEAFQKPSLLNRFGNVSHIPLYPGGDGDRANIAAPRPSVMPSRRPALRPELWPASRRKPSRTTANWLRYPIGPKEGLELGFVYFCCKSSGSYCRFSRFGNFDFEIAPGANAGPYCNH